MEFDWPVMIVAGVEWPINRSQSNHTHHNLNEEQASETQPCVFKVLIKPGETMPSKGDLDKGNHLLVVKRATCN